VSKNKTRWTREFKLRALSRLDETVSVAALEATLGGRHHLYKDERSVRLSRGRAGWLQSPCGWLGMVDHLRAELALSALDMAIGNRYVTKGEPIHQPDQGVQYACGDYIARLERAGIQPSMSRAGCPWDNAMAESFMRTLKREAVNGQAYRDRAEAEASIEALIEAVYNRQRLPSALAYLAPEEFEAKQNAPSCVAASVAGRGLPSPVAIEAQAL
jgi:hypothetical protein